MTPSDSDDIGLIRHAFTLLEEGRLNALFELADNGLEVENAGAERAVQGRPEVRRALDRWLDESKRWRAVDVRFQSLAGGVLASGRLESESALGSPITLPIAWLFTVRGGRVARVEMFANERHAQQAVESRYADSP